MSLQDFLTQALQKGERIKSQILDEVLESPLLNQLLKNEKVLNGLIAVLNARSDIKHRVHRNLDSFFKLLRLPTHEEIQRMEKKVDRIETEIETMHRKILTKRLRQKRPKKSAAGR